MDWGKVDAPLASALAGASGEEPLSVFVQIDRAGAAADRAALARLGLGPDPAEVTTATLSAAQLDALTDEDWVLYVRLSGRLRLLREPAPAPAPAKGGRPAPAPAEPRRSAPAGQGEAGAGDEDRRPKQQKRKRRPT